jgi:hypothetical protein
LTNETAGPVRIVLIDALSINVLNDSAPSGHSDAERMHPLASSAARSFVAEGSWSGHVEPAELTDESNQTSCIAMQLTIADGPIARQKEQPSAAISIVGRRAVLVDSKEQALRWRWDKLAPRRVRVTAKWNSHTQQAYWDGTPMLLRGARSKPTDLYSVLVVSSMKADQAPSATMPRP